MPPRKSLPVEKAATVAPTTKDTSPLPQAAQPARAMSVLEGTETVEGGRAGHGGHPHGSKGGVNIEDLNLPKSIVSRLAKENLPAGTQIQATAILGIQKSVTVFINYLANQSNEYAIGAQRKTVSPQDVLRAIEEVGFGEWREQLEQELKTFEANAKAKRDKNKGAKEGEEGDKEARPRKKLKGYRDEVEAQEEAQEVELGEEQAEAEEEKEDEQEDADSDLDQETDAEDANGLVEVSDEESEEVEELRVRGESEDEALDNGDDSD